MNSKRVQMHRCGWLAAGVVVLLALGCVREGGSSPTSADVTAQSSALQVSASKSPGITTWGGPGQDRGSAVARDAAGNVYVLGSTNSFGAGGWDILITKYDPSTKQSWARTWGGPADDIGRAIAVGPDGFLYITGATMSSGAGWFDMVIVKLETADGTVVWNRTLGGSSYDSADDLAFDDSGNIIVTGESYACGGACANAAILMKLAPDGALLWSKAYRGLATYTVGYAVAVDAQGKIVVSGMNWNYDVSPSQNSVLILKADAGGDVNWARTWIGPSLQQDESLNFHAVAVDADRNIYVGGRQAVNCAADFGTCDFDALVLKVDPDGVLAWAKIEPRPGWGTAGSLAVDTDGTLLVSGVDDGSGVPGFFVSRYDASGTALRRLAWTHGTPAFTEGGTSEIAMVLSGGKTVLAGHSALVGDISFVGQPWIEVPLDAVDATGTWRSDSLQPYAPVLTVETPATLASAPPFGVGVTNFGGGGADLFLSVTGLGAIADACLEGDDCSSGFCVHGICSRLCAYNPGPEFTSGFSPVTCSALSGGSQVTLLTSPLLPDGSGSVTVGFQTPFTGEVGAGGGTGCPGPSSFILDPPGATPSGLPHYWIVAIDPPPAGDTEVCLTYDQAWFGPESAAEASLQILHGFSSPLVSGVCDPAGAGWTTLTPSRPVDTDKNIVCGTTQTFPLLLPGRASRAPIGSPCTTAFDCVPEAFCTDGVCCETACGDSHDDDCQVCSADKGAVLDGACTLLGSTHKCRDSSDPICDLGAFCAGGPDCPANTPAPKTTRCYTRPADDQCAAREATIECGGNLTCAQSTQWQDQGCVHQDDSTLLFTLSDGADPPATVTVQFTDPWPGTISVKRATGCPAATSFTFPPGIDPAANYWDLDAQPSLDGTFDVTVCISYPQSWFGGTDPAEIAQMESSLQLRHGNSDAQITETTCDPDLAGWSYLPSTSVNPTTNQVCANTSTLSPFALMIPSGVDQLPTLQLPGLITAPATSAAGAVVNYRATATDTKDGALVPTCLPASGSKFPLGQTTVTCKVIDSDHLTSEGTFNVWVQVQAPNDGTFFLPPINPDGSSIFKGGTIPVKFKLTGASASIADLTAHLLLAKVSGGVSGTELEAASTSAADSGNVFRYDPAARQYVFNLSAKSLSDGTWSLRADLGDRVDHQVKVSIKSAR